MEFYIEVAKRISPIQNVLLRQDIETVPIFFSPPHLLLQETYTIFVVAGPRFSWIFWKERRCTHSAAISSESIAELYPLFSTWVRLSSLGTVRKDKNNRLVALWFFAWQVIVLQTLASLRGKLLPARNSSIGRFLFRLRLLTLEDFRVQWAKTSRTTKRWFRNPFPELGNWV